MGEEERDRTIQALCEVAKTSDVEEAFRILNSKETDDIYFLRVPPNLNSAREAIRWLNHGIDPEEFAIET